MFKSNPSISVVGAGRLGSSLAIGLSQRGMNITALSSRREAHRVWLQNRLPGTETFASPGEAAQRADVIFITTSDSAIRDVCSQIDWQPHQAVAHCSAALGPDVLDAAVRASAAAGAIHPLQTFPSPDSQDLFHRSAFAIESEDESFRAWLISLAQSFGGKTFKISGVEDRAAYHAAAVMSCGLLAGLAGISAELWQRFGVKRDRAIDFMSPMITNAAEQIAQRGIPDSLTGPYTRGDVATIRKHLEATKRHSTDISRAYSSLALAQLHIAAEQEGIDEAAQLEIRTLLEHHIKSL